MKLSLGRVVIVRTPDNYNGSQLHPAIINRVWGTGDTRDGGGQCANVTVLADCALPFSMTSVMIFDTPEEAGEAPHRGWWPPRVND